MDTQHQTCLQVVTQERDEVQGKLQQRKTATVELQEQLCQLQVCMHDGVSQMSKQHDSWGHAHGHTA